MPRHDDAVETCAVAYAIAADAATERSLRRLSDYARYDCRFHI